MLQQHDAVLQQQPRRGTAADSNASDDDDDQAGQDAEPTDQEFEERTAEIFRLYNAGAPSPHQGAAAAAAAAAATADARLGRRALDTLVVRALATRTGRLPPCPPPPRDQGAAQRCRARMNAVEVTLAHAQSPPLQPGLQTFLWNAAAAPPWPRNCGHTPVDLTSLSVVLKAELVATAAAVVVPCAGRAAVVAQWLLEGMQTVLVVLLAGDTAPLLGTASASVLLAGDTAPLLGTLGTASASVQPQQQRFPATRLWSALSAADLALKQWLYVGYSLEDADLLNLLLQGRS